MGKTGSNCGSGTESLGRLILPANAKRTATVRPVKVFSAAATFDHRSDGTIYVRSPHALNAYPNLVTDRLEHWAARTPGQTFLAQRDAEGRWRALSYSEALGSVRSIAQALVNRGLNSSTAIAILSGNSIEHGLLALACNYAGIPYAPISPSYSLASSELTTLRYLWQRLEPKLVFAAEGSVFEKPLASVFDPHTELVTVTPTQTLRATPFSDLTNTAPNASLDDAHKSVKPDGIAKILFTSGSTGSPKGVITTHCMLCSNQEMLCAVMPFLSEEPPVLCDWLPWNHTFGGSHNVGIALYNGGSLYIDEGKPTPAAFPATVRNLRDIATTAYFNVPRGYEMLVEALKADPAFNRQFFSRVKVLFYAAAGLVQRVWDELQELAIQGCGENILMLTGLGATESAPMALSTNIAGAAAGHVGLPVPGVELKLVPTANKLEARLRGPNITPGFWRAPEVTAAAFDEEGFYKLGDALVFADANNPLKGFCFDGRMNEDFKLSTGTWVSVGPLRNKFLTAFAGIAQDAVFTAPDRDFIGALLFPAPGASPDAIRERLRTFAQSATGNSTRVERVLILDQPASMDGGELTDKGTINQKAVLKNRAALVEEIYSDSLRVIKLN